MAIDVKPFVELADKHKDFVLGLHLEHLHHDGCELEHVACAVLYLAGALDNAQSMIEELLADREILTFGKSCLAQEIVNRAVHIGEMQDKIARLRAQLESAKAWIPAWAWEEMNSPEEDEAWKNL